MKGNDFDQIKTSANLKDKLERLPPDQILRLSPRHRHMVSPITGRNLLNPSPLTTSQEWPDKSPTGKTLKKAEPPKQRSYLSLNGEMAQVMSPKTIQTSLDENDGYNKSLAMFS